MGKIIRAQKVGSSPRRRSPSHRFAENVRYPHTKRDGNAELPHIHSTKTQRMSRFVQHAQHTSGTVVDIIHDSGRTAPLSRIRYEDGKEQHFIAQVGVTTGDIITIGKAGEIKEGNVMSIREIPEGTLVSNVELTPGDGGKISRAAGTFCRIVTHDLKGTVIQLPSGSLKTINSGCFATVGIVAGAGREEKPMLKAGKHHHLMKARNKLWPVVKGVNMNPVDHPFGGGGHPHIGKPKTVSRHAPPGRKIGSIAARRTGKKR